MTAAVSKRLLIVDDEPAMHDSYARCFAVQRGAAENALDAMAAERSATTRRRRIRRRMTAST